MNTPLLALIGGTEIMWIAIVVLVLFGAKKVPELMKGVGTGIKEFKKASRDVQDEMERATYEAPPAPTPTPKKPAETVSQSGPSHS
ncbi:MAG TPA: twin-arginine translocase TatA/TatE family subunit [Candidatus Limnocylindria bacterium]|jgi:sec-independent protein translocase protein TatA|nr:twin-arginine translocase TatA/TatE family subunit [Candidatus Limnocylindria bacterium]